MPRMRFTKEGTAVWISHLDLMRALQRAFRRTGLQLKHSQGFTPHPTLSIALPLSVGMESEYEFADFEFAQEEAAPLDTVAERLNEKLPKGITVQECYDGGQKIGKIKWLAAGLTLLYDSGVPEGAEEALTALLQRPSLPVEKHGKNGPQTVDLAPMLRAFSVVRQDAGTLLLHCTVSAQNPTCNPLLLVTAIETHLPAFAPSFSRCRRLCLYNETMEKFI